MDCKDRETISEFLDMELRLFRILKEEGFVNGDATPAEIRSMLQLVAAELGNTEITPTYLIVFCDAFYKMNAFKPYRSKTITLKVVVDDAIGRYEYSKQLQARRTNHFGG